MHDDARPRDPGLTDRVVRRVHADFPDEAAAVLEQLTQVESGGQDRERVVAAVVVCAAGDLDALRVAVRTSQLDWRDALVAGGLAEPDWPQRLDQVLGAP